jgi:hypothetical protein
VSSPPALQESRRHRDRKEDSAQRFDSFAVTVNSVLTRLVNSSSRRKTETGRAAKARTAALKMARQRLAEAQAAGKPVILADIMHAAWEHLERAGGDTPVSVKVGEATQASVVRACADYFSSFILPYPKKEQRPPAEYLALALLYGMPGVNHPTHTTVRGYLPDLRTLKHYGFSVHKFTNAQRYISRAAYHTLGR